MPRSIPILSAGALTWYLVFITIQYSCTGVEETLFRATLVPRDEWARKHIFSGRPLTEAQNIRKREIWACSINAAMV